MISAIVPMRNEVEFIESTIRSLENCRLDSSEFEILLIDGGSTDGTLQIVHGLTKEFRNVKVLFNPDCFVSSAFNIGFKKSAGEYIGLLGAHAVYPENYLGMAIANLENDEPDTMGVGGYLIQKGTTETGWAIAHCMSTKFGVGNVPARTTKEKGYVESVAFAIYRREVFEKVGFFDEELIRNQDDEFHYRILDGGYRLLMVPEMATEYFVRSTLLDLLKQYFQYGLYKPLVIKKVKSALRIRHIVPALFVVYLLSLIICIWYPWWCIPLIFYSIFDFWFSGITRESLKTKILSIITFPIMHIGYGTGFISGLFKL